MNTFQGLDRFCHPNPIFCNLFEFPAKVWTHLKGSTDFAIQTQFFAICLNFHQQNWFLPHLSSENCEINSIKSDSPRAFQQHQEHPPPNCNEVFGFQFYLIFHWKNGSIINSFHIIVPQTVSNQVGAPPYSSRAFQWYQGHGMNNRSMFCSVWVEKYIYPIHTWAWSTYQSWATI